MKKVRLHLGQMAPLKTSPHLDALRKTSEKKLDIHPSNRDAFQVE
jgi:hypothetical protein